MLLLGVRLYPARGSQNVLAGDLEQCLPSVETRDAPCGLTIAHFLVRRGSATPCLCCISPNSPLLEQAIERLRIPRAHYRQAFLGGKALMSMANQEANIEKEGFGVLGRANLEALACQVC